MCVIPRRTTDFCGRRSFKPGDGVGELLPDCLGEMGEPGGGGRAFGDLGCSSWDESSKSLQQNLRNLLL